MAERRIACVWVSSVWANGNRTRTRSRQGNDKANDDRWRMVSNSQFSAHHERQTGGAHSVLAALSAALSNAQSIVLYRPVELLCACASKVWNIVKK